MLSKFLVKWIMHNSKLKYWNGKTIRKNILYEVVWGHMSLGTDWKLTPYLYGHCHCIHCCEWASVILNLLVWLAASNGYGTWEWDPLIKGPSVVVLPCVCMVAIPFLYSILMISQDPHHDHEACLFQSLCFWKGIHYHTAPVHIFTCDRSSVSHWITVHKRK